MSGVHQVRAAAVVALGRAEAADEALAEFEASLETRDEGYESWSKVELPAIIAEGLKSLVEGPLQVEGN